MILQIFKIIYRTPQYALFDMESCSIIRKGTRSQIAQAMRDYRFEENDIRLDLDNPTYVVYPNELSEILKEGKIPEEFVTEKELKPLVL